MDTHQLNAEERLTTPIQEINIMELNGKDNKDNKDKDKTERGNWTSKYDYLLSAAGMAIGIGNVWRFPYLCYRNGGGAFLIPYLTMLMLVGIPVFLLETSVGQFASSGCITLYRACPAFKGIGYTMAITTAIASSYYSVVIAYPLVFLKHSMTSSLPWASCNNSWNTEACILPHYHNYSIMAWNDTRMSASEEFFRNEILEIDQSSGIGEPGSVVSPVFLANLFVWMFTFLCIFKGVNVLGKVVWFTATFPFVMLFILFFRGVTLPGAWLGIKYYITPDFKKLLDLQVWSDAASQIIFSSGIGWGSLITLGSFNKWKNNTIRDAVFITILNCSTSIFAGFVVFSVLGFMAHTTSTPVEDVTAGGPALAFITYPQALALMPAAPLWSVLFFAMLFFLGVDSLFVQTETIIVALTDEFPKLKERRPWVTFVICGIILLMSISCCTQGGLYMLNLLDLYSVPIPILTVCFAEVCVFAYIYGGGRLVQDISIMTGKGVPVFWWLMWVVICPPILLIMVVNTVYNIWVGDSSDPTWAVVLGWLSVLIPLCAIPLLWVAEVLFTRRSSSSCLKALQKAHAPLTTWGPQKDDDVTTWRTEQVRHPLGNRLSMPSYLKSSNWSLKLTQDTALTQALNDINVD